jgi:hypothetical protein
MEEEIIEDWYWFPPDILYNEVLWHPENNLEVN